MMILAFIGVVFVVLLLLFITAISIEPSQYSQFELDRRHREGDDEVKSEHQRTLYYADLVSLQRVAISILLVVSVLSLVALTGWIVGIILAVLLALEYGAIARISYIRRLAQNVYSKYETKLIQLIQRYPKVAKILRTITTAVPEPRLQSREELLHLIGQAGIVLSRDEKQMITHGLRFSDRFVSEVMTPRGVIDSLKKGELLGPLVLDDLHKTGHSRIPIIDGDLDHVVGILHLRDLLTLDTSRKHTAKVETVMDSHVYYIHEQQSLAHALAAFLKTHHHLFVVVNEYRETVGLLSLEDVLEAMLGRKIVDEFDAHDDLRAVAARNPRGNNMTTKTAKDV